jgi:hypothetical protein
MSQFNPYTPFASKSAISKIAKAPSKRQRDLNKRLPVTVYDYRGAADAPRVEVIKTGFETALYL